MSKRVKNILAITGILVICFLLISFIVMYFGASQKYVTTELEQYRKFVGHIEKEDNDLFSGLKIFPNQITGEMQDVSYYYECGNFALDNNYLIFLDCQWVEEAFEAEVERLKGLYVEHNSEKKQIVSVEDLFVLPAYVSIYEAGSMEYALIDKENRRITYIYSQFTSDVAKKIDEKYLPLQHVENKMFENGYNMYFFEIAQGEGMYIK